MAERIALLGLGRMGAPMGRRLLDAGYDVAGFDLGAAARERFGAAAATPREAARGADTLILMLPDSQAVEAALAGDVLDALPAGGLIVDMGSSDPVRTRVLAPPVEARGLAFVDAPVSGGVAGAEAGTLTIMVGGERAAVARVRPVLDVLGSSVVHVGPVGAGHALKALNNLLSATHLLASAEVLEVGRRFGLDPETMLAAINRSSGRSFSTETKLPRFVLPETYDSGFALGLMTKDVETAVGLARSTGASTGLAAATAALWRRAAAEVGGDADHTAIARWVAGRD